MRFSRRDLLATFLGTAVANGCRRSPTRPPVPGSLVDSSLLSGHRLRGAPLPRIQPGAKILDALIIGGGVAGLSAAWRLQSAGLTTFEMLELDSQPGGTARSGSNAVSAYPWGAHYLPVPLRDRGPIPRLLRELGAITGVDDTGTLQFAEQMLVGAPEERLYYRGSWYEGLYLRAGATPDDLEQLHRFEKAMSDFATARDGQGRRAFSVPIASGSDDAEWTQLDKLSMSSWLSTNQFTSPRLQWLVDYACRDDFGAGAGDISAWAGIWYFAARQDGGDGASYLTWPEGNGALVRQLATSVPAAALHTRTLAHGLQFRDGVWVAHAVDADGRPSAIAARQVVLACPRFVAAHVVDEWRTSAPPFVREFQYSPWAVANVTLAQPPAGRGFPLAWDNVLYESKSLGYVVATHQRARASAIGPTVVTWYYPLSGSDVVAERTRLLSTTYAEWESVVMADLSLPHDVQATQMEVMRWGHGMVRPRPGFIWGAARLAAAVPLHGSLHFAHSDLGGLALFEEANHAGVSAAEAVLAGLGRQSQSWL